MEFELEPRPPDDTWAWRRSLIALAVLIGFVVAAGLWSAGIRREGTATASNEKSTALVTGDLYIRYDQAIPSRTASAAALRHYEEAVPWPSAYRRLGVMKESYGKSGLKDFEKLDSRQATCGMSKKQIASLRSEKAMWLRIFSGKKLTAAEAERYIEKIKSLNLGPLKKAAIAQVYWRSGDHKKYDQIRAESHASARAYIAVLFVLLAILVMGGIAGLIGALVFLQSNAERIAHAPPVPLQSSMLMTAFIVYLGSYIGLSGLAEALAAALGLAEVSQWSGLAYVGLVIFSAAAAFGLGMLVLVSRSGLVEQDWRQIGFRTSNPLRETMQGLAGFFASLPFVFVAAVIAALLNKTVFRNFPTPDQPLDDIISTGGTLEIALTLFAAAVVAPIVEETFFRGALYTAFRTRIAVWPSVFVTSAIFAAIHPLPGGFLPIFALACVLAVLRERSGSLLPCMVCHSVYNTVVLVVAALMR